MFEEIKNALTNLEVHIANLSKLFDQNDPSILWTAPQLLRNTRSIVNDTRAFLVHAECLKHRCWQMYGGQAYSECPEIMFAPVGNWHGTLDAMQYSLKRLERKASDFYMQ